MAVRSQNGWLANDRSVISSYKIPGGKVALRKGDVATILVYFANRYHNEVERLEWPGNWGYAERKIRGSSTTVSNHASGTALDLNAPQHPLGKRGTFTKSQVRALDRILADCEGVLRHGKNYSSRKDEMHVEINKGSAAVRALAKKIRAGEKPGGKGAPAPAPSSSNWKPVKYGDQLRNGVQGPPVREWQEYGLGYTGSKVDGYFGDDTERDTKAVQKRNGLPQTGVVDSKTWNTRRKPKPKPKSTVPGPGYAFPLPKGYYFGPKSGGNSSVSGFHRRLFKGVSDQEWLKRFATQLARRGWSVGKGKTWLGKSGNDGKFGDEYEALIKAFQEDQGLRADGLLGRDTWDAAFKNRIS